LLTFLLFCSKKYFASPQAGFSIPSLLNNLHSKSPLPLPQYNALFSFLTGLQRYGNQVNHQFILGMNFNSVQPKIAFLFE
jgi:hypothetical protein